MAPGSEGEKNPFLFNSKTSPKLPDMSAMLSLWLVLQQTANSSLETHKDQPV